MAEPFSGATLVVDVLRVAAALACLGLTAACVLAAVRAGRHTGYRLLFVAVALLATAAIGTQLERLGLPMSYRLVTELAAVATATAALWQLRDGHDGRGPGEGRRRRHG